MTTEIEAREAELDRRDEARQADDERRCPIHDVRLDPAGDCWVCWVDDDAAYSRRADL